MASNQSISISLLLLLALGGCRTIDMELPDRFVQFDSWDGFKATTPAERSRLWVREFDDDDRAPLSFWSETLVTEMTENRGYLLIAASDIKDASGHAGRAMEFEVSLGGRPFREYMAVFVIEGVFGNTVRVAEYVAETATFTAEIDAVKPAVLTIR
jgi:hypothetical protein